MDKYKKRPTILYSYGKFITTNPFYSGHLSNAEPDSLSDVIEQNNEQQQTRLRATVTGFIPLKQNENGKMVRI